MTTPVLLSSPSSLVSGSSASDRYTMDARHQPAAAAAASQSVMLDLPNVGNQAALTVHAANAANLSSLAQVEAAARMDSFSAEKLPAERQRGSVLRSQLSSGFDTTFFEFNDASSLTQYFITTAIAKAHSAVWPRFVSGLLSGLFVVLGAVFALVAAGGISETVRSASPAIPKILSGVTFPIALILIMFVGGDLFTGNCMYVALGWLTGRVSLRQALNVLLVSFFSNLCGCLFFSYFLAYRTELFVAEPFNSWMLSVAEGKVALDWGVVVLRAIGANALVCIGIFMGSSSRDALGRFVIAWIPVLVFSVIGYEHVVANMAFIPTALMYGGTDFSTAQYIARSMLPAAIGNIIGGGLMLGGFLAYLYAWKSRSHASLQAWLRFNFVPNKPLLAVVEEMGHQLLYDLPIEQ